MLEPIPEAPEPIRYYLSQFKGRTVNVYNVLEPNIPGYFSTPVQCVDLNEHGALLRTHIGEYYFTFPWPYYLGHDSWERLRETRKG